MDQTSLLGFPLFKALALLSLAPILVLAGCAGDFVQPQAAPARLISGLHGRAKGGEQLITGANIQLWAMSGSASVNGDGGTPIGNSVTTDAHGAFSLPSFTCGNPNQLLYLTATGGNPGLGPNVYNYRIAAMTILDVCSRLTSDRFIVINELTTVAAVFTYGQFLTAYPNIGFTSSNAVPGYSDTTDFKNIIDASTGTAPGPLYQRSTSYPFTTLNTLASIIATCINSADGVAGDGTPCGTLFALTTPPGGIAPTNTVDALITIQRNPFLNLTKLTNLVTPAAPYQPTLTKPPANWYMRLTSGVPPSQGIFSARPGAIA